MEEDELQVPKHDIGRDRRDEPSIVDLEPLPALELEPIPLAPDRCTRGSLLLLNRGGSSSCWRRRGIGFWGGSTSRTRLRLRGDFVAALRAFHERHKILQYRQCPSGRALCQ